jgi:pimeloyl-ACP methyl ester carboxylesterase
MQLTISKSHVSVNGIPLHYFSAGDGPPMLLLPGLGTSSDTWRRNVTPLSGFFTLYAPDFPNSDSSSTLRTNFSLDLYVETLRTFLSMLNIERTHLVGLSEGGAVAALLSQRFPEKVHRLILISAAGLQEERAVLMSNKDLLREASGVLNPHRPQAAKLESIMRKPVMLISGEEDRFIDRRAVCYITARNLNAKCVIVPDAGHFPHEEFPETVSRHIITYCTETPINTWCG